MSHKNKQNWNPYTKGKKRSHSGAGRHKSPERIFEVGEANDRLLDIFTNHGFADFPHDKRHSLAEFYRILMLNQQHNNFTRLLKLRDVAIKHFIDSLIVARLVDLQFPLLDVGTGPGFPGIPLKILYPDQLILLAEGVQKRVEFLKEVRDKLDLKELRIIGRNINPEFSYPVQGVITRAVEDARNTLGNVINCLQVGGCVYLMKGPGVDPEIELAEKSWGEYYSLEKDIAYELPQTPHKRRLLVYRKIKSKELSPEEFDL